jgi:hypothetical protein
MFKDIPTMDNFSKGLPSFVVAGTKSSSAVILAEIKHQNKLNKNGPSLEFLTKSCVLF